MARFALSPRPPIVASASLFALVVMLGPRPVAMTLEPEPMGPSPTCVVHGDRRGELYLPDPSWTSQMPTLVPRGHWTMPILPPHEATPILDVDSVVSGLKRLLATPHT
ncbi:MAG: hypothetical protein ABI591_25380 [Kofleriaceae bacterium]